MDINNGSDEEDDFHHVARRQRRDGNNNIPAGDGGRRGDGLVPIHEEATLARRELTIDDILINASPFASIRNMDQLTGNGGGGGGGGGEDSDSSDSDDEDGIPFSMDSLDVLTTKGTNYRGQQMNSIMGVLISFKTVRQVQTNQFNRGRQQNSGKQIHTNQRILHVLDPKAPPGNNVFAVIEATHGGTLFLNDLAVRDSGHLRPGCFILFRTPSIRNRLSNGTPIVETRNPFILLQPGFNLPDRRPLVDTTVQTGVILNGASIDFRSFDVTDCRCAGSTCDLQNFPSAYGRVGDQNCPCFRSSNLGNHVYPALNFEITRGDIVLPAEGFLSKYFIERFLFRERGFRLTPSHFHGQSAYVSKKIKKVFRYGNQNGGWTIIGWNRMALVDDQASVQASNQGQGGFAGNNQTAQVAQGTTNFHVVKIEPTRPDLFDARELRRRQLSHSTLNPS